MAFLQVIDRYEFIEWINTVQDELNSNDDGKVCVTH